MSGPAGGKPEKSAGLSARGAVIAGVAVVLLLTLATWGAVFYGSVREVNGMLAELEHFYFMNRLKANLLSPEEAVEKLGGKDRTTSRLSLYLQLPRCVAPHKVTAVRVLACCGETAVPTLTRALQDGNGGIRYYSADALGRIGPSARGAIPALKRALAEEKDEQVREVLEEALEKIQGEE